MASATFIIAEAGVNHNGSLEMAEQLIDVAAAAGADAVKFQTFRADQLVSATAPKAEYQTRTTDITESQHEMIKKLELDEAAHARLIAHCANRKIQFLSTPFDHESLRLLTSRFELSLLKIPSGEITNAPLLLAAARTGRRILLSTGMSTLGEVEEALGVLAFGYIDQTTAPSREAFGNAWRSPIGQAALQRQVALLHCTTEYPAPLAEVNLRAMDTLAVAFGLPVGYSDHTEGIALPLAAVARGATIIEKHFTLDRSLPGPDHRASLEPEELRRMVQGIREVELALGNGRKQPTPSEMKNMAVARKSLVAARPIAAGEQFDDRNVVAKRPGTGLSPFCLWELQGRVATRAYAPDDMISE